MSTPIIAVPLPVREATQAVPQAFQAQGQFSAQDVDRLRSLVADVPPAQNVSNVNPNTTVAPTQDTEFRTLGDSILNGISKFNSGYHDSLNSISQKIETISNTDPLQLGSNFGEIMALQVEVARWSMSVTGVDNASKAGTNTIKELSKGG